MAEERENVFNEENYLASSALNEDTENQTEILHHLRVHWDEHQGLPKAMPVAPGAPEEHHTERERKLAHLPD